MNKALLTLIMLLFPILALQGQDRKLLTKLKHNTFSWEKVSLGTSLGYSSNYLLLPEGIFIEYVNFYNYHTAINLNYHYTSKYAITSGIGLRQYKLIADSKIAFFYDNSYFDNIIHTLNYLDFDLGINIKLKEQISLEFNYLIERYLSQRSNYVGVDWYFYKPWHHVLNVTYNSHPTKNLLLSFDLKTSLSPFGVSSRDPDEGFFWFFGAGVSVSYAIFPF